MREFASVPLLTVRSTFHLMSIFVLRFIEPLISNSNLCTWKLMDLNLSFTNCVKEISLI